MTVSASRSTRWTKLFSQNRCVGTVMKAEANAVLRTPLNANKNNGREGSNPPPLLSIPPFSPHNGEPRE
uniref:Uncharacterized protein n=1 Tax=Arion vulgaris TaxID=1028688 RepID=A0A0B7AH83_9EUPU